MNLKLRFAIIMFTLLSVFVSANADTGDVLVVEPNNAEDQTQQFYLSESPKIVFGADEIVVYHNATTAEEFTTFSYSQVKRIYITSLESSSEQSGETTSVEEELKKENIFSFRYVDGQTVCIAGIEPNTVIGLYSVNGQKIPMETNRSDNEVVISLSSLPRGIYVIRCNNQSFKIYKKS